MREATRLDRVCVHRPDQLRRAATDDAIVHKSEEPLCGDAALGRSDALPELPRARRERARDPADSADALKAYERDIRLTQATKHIDTS